LKVSLVYSGSARQVWEWDLDVFESATVRQALAQCGVLNEFPSLAQAPLMLGVWGKRASLETILQHNDRIEIYRKLEVDPKVARRERFSRQGAKGAGLFSTRRPGSKAGY
jgi:putative ubiquitin-RnfH superfamily antitoxin RatB of RatAB toxin-antitoxin module